MTPTLVRRPRIGLVSREVYPFGGGIGTYVGALAAFLADDHEVTLFLSSMRQEGMAIARRNGELQFDERVRLVYVPEPAAEDVGSYFSHMHCYSSRLWDA